MEFRSSTSVNEKKRQKALKKLSGYYENHNPVTQQEIKFEIKPGGDSKIHTTESVLNKFTSADMTQQLHISKTSFLVSQLAPYPGWAQLESRIKRDWDTWKSAVDFRPIERVGMRYINRIDLPILGPLVRYEDYVTVYPALPPLLDPSVYHSVNVKVRLEDIQSDLNLISAVVQSPLPNHLAIVLDLDIVRKYQTPPTDEELFSYISQARNKKNEVFEACITEKARELFTK